MNCECEICKNNKPFDLPKDIINAAIEGELVLFCGAGISTESKNVLPFSLYKAIQDELKITDNTLSFSVLMQKYCDQPNGRKKLLNIIRKRLNYIDSFPELQRQATSFHRELSTVYPIRTIITTNWDSYFEEYCGAIPITIPEDFAFWDDKTRCVLKIHGSMHNLSSIVATTDDYNRSFCELQNGIIGATLKSIIATKTVVFIGFSFGDEDFNQIIDYLYKEMGDIFPHIYVVTLDETLEKRLEYKNSTVIVTSGSFFLHKLKEKLIEEKILINLNAFEYVDEALYYIAEYHRNISKIDLSLYPCAVYTLAYQDGVIHAFERLIQNYKTGEYNRPGMISRLILKYEKDVVEYIEHGNYWDAAYFEGYINGLTFIGLDKRIKDVKDIFPFYYLPNAKRELATYDIYVSELERVSHENDEYQKQAKNIVNRLKGDDLVVHHPPY